MVSRRWCSAEDTSRSQSVHSSEFSGKECFKSELGLTECSHYGLLFPILYSLQ